MKRFNLVFAGLVFTVFALFLAVEGAEAFCVHNKTDRQIEARQTSGHKTGRGFGRDKLINPGDNKCCNWQDKGCNKEGKRDSVVKFKVTYSLSGSKLPANVLICEDFPIQAGGALTVVGSNGNYRCVDNDGTPPTPMPVPKPKF